MTQRRLILEAARSLYSKSVRLIYGTICSQFVRECRFYEMWKHGIEFGQRYEVLDNRHVVKRNRKARFTRDEVVRLQRLAHAEGMTTHALIKQTALARLSQDVPR